MARKKTSESVKTAVLTQSRRRCALCAGLSDDYSPKEIGQIAHIDRDNTNNAESNLAWLCLECHCKYDAKYQQSASFTPAELTHYKGLLVEMMARTTADWDTLRNVVKARVTGGDVATVVLCGAWLPRLEEIGEPRKIEMRGIVYNGEASDSSIWLSIDGKRATAPNWEKSSMPLAADSYLYLDLAITLLPQMAHVLGCVISPQFLEGKPFCVHFDIGDKMIEEISLSGMHGRSIGEDSHFVLAPPGPETPLPPTFEQDTAHQRGSAAGASVPRR